MRWAALSEKSTSDTVAPVPLSASTSAVRALRTAPASTDAERSTTMVTLTPHVGESDGLAATDGAGSAHPAGTVTGPSPSTSGVQTGSTDDAGGSLVATVALVSAGALLAGSEATGSVEAAGSVVSAGALLAGSEAAGGSVAIGSDGALGSLVATGDVVAAVGDGAGIVVVDATGSVVSTTARAAGAATSIVTPTVPAISQPIWRRTRRCSRSMCLPLVLWCRAAARHPDIAVIRRPSMLAANPNSPGPPGTGSRSPSTGRRARGGGRRAVARYRS